MEENSMFDLFEEQFRTLYVGHELIDEKDATILNILREKREKGLSECAFRSSQTRGRRYEEEPCAIRTCYQRDIGRIIFSQSFRRLRNKTQVFFNPTNDHICSRIEHVIYVNYISSIIAGALNLNTDLVQAIAMGHDVGHAPFGHSGERILSKCMKSVDENLFFEHEQQSLRVLDVLEEHTAGRFGLNLSFEVRDGIVSHCGETYDERSLKPFREKTEEQLTGKGKGDRTAPCTLEGCVVRFADKVAYIGRDVEDAFRAGLISQQNHPKQFYEGLGDSNSQIINSLVRDIIHSSVNKDEISMSEKTFKEMESVLNSNLTNIYKAPKIERYEAMVNNTIEGLFEVFIDSANDVERACASEHMEIKKFGEYITKHPDAKSCDAVKVADYISGMTDTYAMNCFDRLFRA